MSEQDLKKIEELIKKHKPSTSDGSTILIVLFLMFLGGCFKNCGY